MTANTNPLVMDIDGTFLRTDMLFECFWAALGKAPVETLSTTVKNFRDIPTLKRRLAEIADLNVGLLPVNAQLKLLADENVKAGRKVVFASASDQRLVSELAAFHGYDETSFGTNEGLNLKGAKKADLLVREFGDAGFDYAGDSGADLKVWPHAQNALVVGDNPKVLARLSAMGKNVTGLGGGWLVSDLIRALRPHQWVKNILLFLPLLAAQEFGLMTFLTVLLGFVAYSAAASCIYIVNDLLDLEADRLHATKHRRPFASGAVPIQVGMATCGALGIAAIALAASLNGPFLGVIILYMVLSLTYSLKWKRLRWLDIVTLALLYTLRVVGGAMAGTVYVSLAMLLFIFPVFLTLGCVKRLTEVTLAKDNNPLPGRGYGRPDRRALLLVAWGGVVAALATFFAYSLSLQAQLLYPLTWILWLALVPIAGWLARMVRLGYFGQMDHDPIVFALRDKRGIGLLLFILALMFFAAGIWQQIFLGVR